MKHIVPALFLPPSLLHPHGTSDICKVCLQLLRHMATMPNLFVTLTADEVSGTKWVEIVDLEAFLQKFNRSFDFSDAPMECVAAIFHQRLLNFLKQHALV
jgi:hypothetical protein